MTATYTQENRMMAVKTPLGKDVMLLAGFTAQEEVSQLFHYQLDLLVEHTRKGENPIPQKLDFAELLGQSVTVEMALADGNKRFFNGICQRVTQGEMSEEFTSYHMELLPKFWLLTRKAQSRIFQPPKSSVPEILKQVLVDLDVEYQLQGRFHPRDYCVQYRESDFNFACRLMEEEGIYYFFKHEDGKHIMVVANNPTAHPSVPGPAEIRYEENQGGVREDDRIHDWVKVQELRSQKYTLWDYTFEKPDSHLEYTAQIQDSVEVGQETHKLRFSNNGKFEIFDYPGEYAQRFDGIDKGGGEQPKEIGKIFEDNQRTAKIRMQEEAAGSLVIQGASNCRHLVAGHTFSLKGHFNADGEYILTSVSHSAQEPSYRSGDAGYYCQNSFTCIPKSEALPYRPARITAKPVIPGTQTAVVVGPPGEEIFTDKYGRVKVQFRWDRDGKNDAGSSCWIRVATLWAGQQWGVIHIPRIGQEVVVAFEEGDPDAPIIVGCVYNAKNMPPYTLPDNKTQSGVKSRSTLNGKEKHFNEFRFDDKKGEEEIYLHAEKNFHSIVENNDKLYVGNDQTIEIKKNRTETVKEGDESVTIEKGNRTVQVDTGDDLHHVKTGNRTVQVDTGDDLHQVKTGNRSVEVDTGNDSHQIKMGNRDVKIEMGNDALDIKMGNQTTKLDLGKSETEAMQSIELKVGQSSIKVDQMGVTIKGMIVKVEGQIQTQVKGLITQVNGDAMLQAKGGITMIN